MSGQLYILPIEQIRGHRREIGATEQRHVAVDLLAQQSQRVPHPDLARDRCRKHHRPAEKNESCPQGKRCEDIGAPPYAAVIMTVRLPAAATILGQDAERSGGAVELPSAVVGNDDSVHALGGGPARVLGVEDCP